MGLARYAWLTALLACGGTPAEVEEQQKTTAEETAPAVPVRMHRRIDVARSEPFAPAARNTTATTPALSDHGGRVVPSMHLYLLFWGTGFEASTPSLYTTFLSGLGASRYWAIDSQYLRGAANHTSFVKAFTDATHPPSATVADAAVQSELARVIGAGSLPYDDSGLYFVVTPKTTKVCTSGACSCDDFCGYHSAFATTKGVVLYASIPSSAACPTACGVFATDAASPNHDLEADEGVSILAHEAEETQSDAYGNAWFDGSGFENGDKCAYQYGATIRGGANAAPVNQSWGGKSWLVQMNWSNAVWACAQH